MWEVLTAFAEEENHLRASLGFALDPCSSILPHLHFSIKLSSLFLAIALSWQHLNRYKVNRCLARYSPGTTTTNQPTIRAQTDQKRQFWAKLGRFWAPNPIFGGQGVKILVPSYRDSNETPFSCWKHWSVRLQLAARGENVLFWPQNLDIWGQKSIFCIVIAIFVNGANEHYTRGYIFPIGTTPKKNFRFRARGHFWGLTPVFGRVGLVTRNVAKLERPCQESGRCRLSSSSSAFAFWLNIFSLLSSSSSALGSICFRWDIS